MSEDTIPPTRASAAKLTANRRNSRKSTGPRDRSRTRYNARKHGLRSNGLAELDDVKYAQSVSGSNAEKSRLALDTSLSAKCIQCGMTITGEEIASLSAEVEALNQNKARLTRLRRGYCARNGCDSYYYEGTFLLQPAGPQFCCG
jgi:hypothetical protein